MLLEHINQQSHMTQVLPQVSCYALGGIIEHPLPEEIELHPTVPTPLDQLQAVEVPFHGSGRPWESQGGVHSRRVPLEPLGAVPQLHTRAGTTGPEPRIEGVCLALTDHGRALLHQLLHVGEFGVLLTLCYEGLVCCRPSLGVLAQQPSALAGSGQLGSRRRRHHGCVLALRPDLAPQAGLICTALRQTGLAVAGIRIALLLDSRVVEFEAVVY